MATHSSMLAWKIPGMGAWWASIYGVAQSRTPLMWLRRRRIPLFIAPLFTIAKAWKQPTCPLTDEWIKKLWYIYRMEYYSAIKRNAFESVRMRLMNLEPIIQSAVSQKEKDKYHILMYIHGIWKDGTMSLFAGQQWRCWRRAQTYRHGRCEWKGEGGPNAESSMETCTLTYMKQPVRICCMTQGTQTWALWQPRGVDGGKKIQDRVDICIPRLIHVNVWQKPTYFKAVTVQLKINRFLKIKN